VKVVVPYLDCRRGYGRLAVPTAPPILARLTGASDQELNLPCAPIKASTA
jgi:hypothetical protein